jgi:ribonucleoside-triphosphate reductase
MSSFDTLLAPFVRYDGLDYPSVKQAMQEFVFNINVPTRVGFQTPFTNLTFDLAPSPVLREEPVILGGELQPETYGEFQAEMDMINRAFAEVMLEGDAKGRVFTFPIPTYNISRDFDWDNEVLEPVWRMTAKYGIPYFSNFINSDMKPEDARSMCCRLRLDNRELRKRGGGLFGANPLTGSIGVVTINLPRLGYLSENEAEFLDRLSKIMDVARTSLEIKRKILEQLTEQGLYPYSRYYLSVIRERQGSFWANHFSTIGLNGMNEACRNFLGVDIADPTGKAFAVRVLRFMRERLAQYQDETGHLYNLEATPAEGATYRLAKQDRSRYSDIIAAGTKDVPYYTNSTHLPVGYTGDIFEALEHQDELQVLYTGGTVLHGFIGEQIDDWKQARLLVRRIAENYRLPYYTLTPTFSICPIHGYIPGEHEFCPHEHSEQDLERYGIMVDDV